MARELMNSSAPRQAARASESVSRTLSVGEGFTPSRVFRHAFRAGINPAPTVATDTRPFLRNTVKRRQNEIRSASIHGYNRALASCIADFS